MWCRRAWLEIGNELPVHKTSDISCEVETWEFVGMHLADLRWTLTPPHGGLEWLILVFPSWNEIFPCIHWEVSSLIFCKQTSKVRSADNKFVKYCTYIKYFRRGKKKLLGKGAIELVPPGQEGQGFYSTFFIVPKKDGGLRPILNLKPLNVHLSTKFCTWHPTWVWSWANCT
jgi:hypothetical protein